MVEDNSTKSTDNFALRPQTYTKSSPASLTQKAGESFWLTLKATGPSNTSLLGYNATVPLTKSLIDTSKVCYFTDGNFTKKDGMPLTSLLFDESESNTSSEVKFNDVGVFTLNLKDTTWTNVDKGKTPAECISNSNTATLDSENRVGCNIENNITITSVPHHFNVSAALSNFEGSLFTYLSSDMNMSAKLDVNITAQSEQNTTTKNYTRECYAADTTHTVNYVSLAVEPSDALTLLKYYETNTSKEGNVSTNLPTFSISHSKDIFTTTNPGTSTLNYKLNFDRNSSKPVNPFDLNISKVTISEPNVEGNDTSVGNAKFYYGRIKTKDIMTDTTSALHALHVEVFSPTSPSNGFYQNTLNWWVNASDDGVTTVDDINASAYQNFTKTTISTLASMSHKIGVINGVLSFHLDKNTSNVTDKQATFHLDIPSWLWYSSIASREYNASRDCSYHPCFDYKFLENASGKKAITSGTFKGSTIGSDYNSTYQKKRCKNISMKKMLYFKNFYPIIKEN